MRQALKCVSWSNTTSRSTDSVTSDAVASFYLTDEANPTGYAQPVEAWTSTDDNRSDASLQQTYILDSTGLAGAGDRVLAQADSSGTFSYLLTDGHGSTQQMTDASGNVTATFNYDAFGTALNFDVSHPPTVFLFGGDAVYDPASGLYMHGDGVRDTLGFLFIQRDTYAGKKADPITLHKYLLASANPVSNSDPSGHWSWQETAISGGIFAILAAIIGYERYEATPPTAGGRLVVDACNSLSGFLAPGNVRVGNTSLSGLVDAITKYNASPIRDLIICAHGQIGGIAFSDPPFPNPEDSGNANSVAIETPQTAAIFGQLLAQRVNFAPGARIVLNSCDSGVTYLQNRFNPAQTIANASGVSVWAPTGVCVPADTATPDAEANTLSNGNWKLFQPQK